MAPGRALQSIAQTAGEPEMTGGQPSRQDNRDAEEGNQVKKTPLILGAISLVLAAILALFDITEIVGFAWRSNVTIYPAAFFALLGIVLAVRSVKS